MTDEMTFKCASCGSTEFELPENPKPDDIVRCHGCGATNRYDVLHDQRIAAAKEHVSDIFKDAFKGKDGWTVT